MLSVQNNSCARQKNSLLRSPLCNKRECGDPNWESQIAYWGPISYIEILNVRVPQSSVSSDRTLNHQPTNSCTALPQWVKSRSCTAVPSCRTDIQASARNPNTHYHHQQHHHCAQSDYTMRRREETAWGGKWGWVEYKVLWACSQSDPPRLD